MDTRTGQIVDLDKERARQAEEAWRMFEVGLINDMPQYAPIKNDKIPVKPKWQRRKRKRGRSYRDFCNG
jgi:hypothetical protein